MQHLNIAALVARVGQEVKHRTIMPQRISPWQSEPEDVRLDQRDRIRPRTEATPNLSKGDRREIQDRNVTKADREQMIDKG